MYFRFRAEKPFWSGNSRPRSTARRSIFRDDRDRERFLGTVEETRELFGVEVHGYVLMENHVHLILMTPGGNLQKFMQRPEHLLHGLLQPTAPEKRSPLSGPLQSDPD